MTVKVPLRYSDRVFAHALIDDEAEPLRDLGYYSVTLPRKLRTIAGGRPDVILAQLKEDGGMVCSCKPFLSILNTQVLLVHMVVRGELGRLMTHYKTLVNPPQYEVYQVKSELNQLRGSIGRIIFADGDSTNCQRHNIREM